MHAIDIDHRIGLVVLTFTGTVHVPERMDAIGEVVSALDRTGFRLVLVDFRSANVAIDSFEESNALASKLAFNETLRHCAVAYTAHPGAKLDPVVEALAAARGFAFRRFSHSGEALGWLLRGQGAARGSVPRA